MAGRSPSSQALLASSAAPRIELPAIQVSREAEADPESPEVALSEKTPSTRSMSTPRAAAVIWVNAV